MSVTPDPSSIGSSRSTLFNDSDASAGTTPVSTAPVAAGMATPTGPTTPTASTNGGVVWDRKISAPPTMETPGSRTSFLSDDTKGVAKGTPTTSKVPTAVPPVQEKSQKSQHNLSDPAEAGKIASRLLYICSCRSDTDSIYHIGFFFVP